MPSHDFDAARRERIAGFDPVEFTIGGEHFVARPAIPFAVIAEHLADERMLTTREAYEVAVAFVRGCLEEVDRERFDQALRNPDEPVGEHEPMVVVMFLLGCYVNRPTKPSDDSSSGRPTTGASSKVTRSASSTATPGRRQRGASSAGSKVA